ncbi:MAG: hypothetical protein HOI95_03480 [Chromatiales bacterium]|nr:hypothetical protein [Chromatiales bacterium]
MEELRRAREDAERANVLWFRPTVLRFTAQAYADLDEIDHSIACLREAEELLDLPFEETHLRAAPQRHTAPYLRVYGADNPLRHSPPAPSQSLGAAVELRACIQVQRTSRARTVGQRRDCAPLDARHT